MTNRTPLNPDAEVSKDQTIFAYEAAERDYPQHGSILLKLHHSNFQSSLWQVSKRTAESLRDQLNYLLAVAQSEAQKLTDAEWQAFKAIPDQGYSHRSWVDARIAERVAVAQPVVNSVEELDALPVGTVLMELSRTSRTAVKSRENGVFFAGELPEYMTFQVSLPARVLYRPEDS